MITLYSEYKIAKIKNVESNYKILSIKSKENIFPGQFFKIYFKGIGEKTLTPLPSEENTLSFLIFDEKDKLSIKLFELKEKDSIYLRGPYGHGFPMNNFLSKDLILIGQNEFLTPLISVMKYFESNNKKYKSLELKIFNNKDNPNEEKFVNNILEKHKDFTLTTLNSDNNNNKLTNEFEAKKDTFYLLSLDFENLKQMMIELESKNILKKNIYVYLNRKINCGVGLCGTCAMNSHHICIDGPVFRSDNLEKVFR